MTDELCLTYGEALARHRASKSSGSAPPPPTKIVITGAPKSGKSTCIHSLGVHACIGKDFEGIEFEHPKQFFLTQDDTITEFLIQRIDEHQTGLTSGQREYVGSNFSFTDRRRVRLGSESDFENFRKVLLTRQPDIWGIDQVNRSLTVGVEPGAFLSRVDAVQGQLGCTVVMTHMSGYCDEYLEWANVIIRTTRDKDGTVTTQCTDYRTSWG